ncbi:GA module-containing protein [Gardnerella vaginalis]|uniref:GA module n=1 Tax=Gardnerella vaginalis TaxID=2702 RepID=A0A2K1SUQ0_GARVA|nr:GA module-containing protein [Gardnerella vaginalis]PNS43238.1 GA module [Gardnerella vaginalis]
MRCDACRRNGAWGGVFVSTPLPAYADGYVDGTGNNIYYGFKTDASYAEAHFNIDVEYYDTLDHAKAGGTEGIDPLGKFVRVHYLSNCNNDATADEWKFRPMWWFGVPAGLKDPQYIHFKRIEKLTKNGKQQVQPAGSSQKITTDANGYGAVSDRHYNSTKEWSNLSNFYFSGNNIATKGWKQLVGLGDKDNSKTYDNAGDTEKQWNIYKQDTQGLKGIFVDWESAGRRWYDMTYVSEMEETTWKNRDKNPLRFAAGVYRFAGNWHYAAGQKHNTPKIADHIGLQYPELTPVKDLKNVSTDEQNAIKDKIKDANKDTKHYSDLVDKVEVSDKGVATITFKDNTTRTISADLLVFKNEEDKDKYKPIMPARTPVVNPSKLTDADKTAVIAAFKTANKDKKDFNDHVKADPDGIKFNDDGTKLIVTYQDGSKLEINASELVCQGSTIADWAPYVVPDYIDVDDLKNLKPEEITKIVSAFDTANTGITPYDDAKKGNGNKAPVTVDKATGNATITWEDGSTTTISAWQFLKEKPKQNPEPSTPTQQGDKTFIVEAPATQTNVNFDPLKMTEADLTNQQNTKTLDGAKALYIGEKGKDAKDSSKKVNIKSVEYSVDDNGVGYITFNADGYTPAKYPMSIFFKQKTDKQTPAPDTTLHHPGQMTAYQYYVDPVQVDNVNSPNPEDQIAAFKKFMKKNYTNVNESDLSTGSYTLKENNTPVSGVTNMQRYVQGQNNGAGVVSFSVNSNGTIAVQGFETGEHSSKKLFDVPLSDLYVAKSQQQKDNTIDHLKDQAKALLDKRRNTDKLTNDDLKRAGIVDPDQLNDAKIDEIAKGQTAEKDLRDLIRKLTDAKKAERKYNPIPEIEVTDPENLSEADFKKAAEAFLKANYDGTDSLAVDKVPYTVPTSLKPKTDTVLMELSSTSNANGIAKVTYKNSDFTTLVFQDSANNDLFSVKVTYKKAGTPAPTPDALAQMKKDAEQQIDRNPNLTKEQKEDYKKQIEEATTADKIKEILNKAAQQGKDNQNDPSKAQTITDNKGGGTAKKEAEDKKQKEEEEHNKQQLQKDKDKAKEALNSLSNLTTDGDSSDKKKLSDEIDNAQTPEEVKNILEKAKAINDAKGALQNDIAKGALAFLDHGTGDEHNTADTHADDAALHELLGGTPGKDKTLTDLETALKDSNATAESINNALAKAKRQNTSNEQNAKIAGIAKLDAKKAELDAAYNALTPDKQASAKTSYDAAIKAIDDAKTAVNNATKPSEIKKAVDGVDTKIDAANGDIKKNTPKRDTTGNTNDDQNALKQEKEKQIERIKNSGLSAEDKKKAIDDINNAKKLGDPTGIADRALKAQKIADALKKIDEFKHLNKAQKDAFKAIINGTDAGNHTNDDGTTSDDIDDALANAANTDNAMARLEKLKEIADKFAKGEKFTGSTDQTKKDAFNTASTAAGAVLAKETGDAKNADQVNELYKDLLKAMQAIDDKAKGAGVITDALQAEVDNDKALKPNATANPATKGDSVYTTASADKKAAFDKALSDAEDALNKANGDNADQAKPDSTPRTPEQEADAQKAVDDALQKLEEARKALDGVNTKPLEQQIAKDADINKSVRYTKASEDKKKAYDDALAAAKKLITDLTTPIAAGASAPKYDEITLDTKENKQKALDKALQTLKDAAAALDGKEPTPTPTPAAVDKTDLAVELSKANTFGRYLSYLISSSDKQDAYNAALAEARRVYGDPNATQEQVNAAAAALRRAAEALRGYFWLDDGTVSPTPSPLPLPDPLPNPGAGTGNAGTGNAGTGSESGYGVNDNAPTTVDKGELNIQIDSAESDLQPGNAGNGNAGAGNAGSNNAGNGGANAGNAGNATNNNAANAHANSGSNANNANGANSAAVNAAVENNPSVKQADAQVSKAQEAVNAALAEAKKVAADPNATQTQVDAAAQKLSAARKALAAAKAHAAQVRASVRAQVLRSSKESKESASLSATGSNVSAFGLFAATLTAAGAALFATKRRGISRHSNR